MFGKPKGLMILVRQFLLNDQVAPAHRSRNQNYPPFYTGIPCKTEQKNNRLAMNHMSEDQNTNLFTIRSL